MNNLDACSILNLIKTTYFETVFDKNEDSVTEYIFSEIIKNEQSLIDECKKQSGVFLALPLYIGLKNANEFLNYIKNQFKKFKEVASVNNFEYNSDRVETLINESIEAKFKVHFPETIAFLYSHETNKNFIIDDGKAFIFFKNHRDCRIKIHLLYEMILEKNIENSQKIKILQVLYHSIYEKIKPNKNEYILTIKINYLKKILGYGETEIIKLNVKK